MRFSLKFGRLFAILAIMGISPWLIGCGAATDAPVPADTPGAEAPADGEMPEGDAAADPDAGDEAPDDAAPADDEAGSTTGGGTEVP